MADLVAHSFSNLDKFLLKHLELNLEIDFDKKIIFGYVNLELEIKKKGATLLVRALQAYILYRVNDIVPVCMYTISIPVLYELLVKGMIFSLCWVGLGWGNLGSIGLG